MVITTNDNVFNIVILKDRKVVGYVQEIDLRTLEYTRTPPDGLGVRVREKADLVLFGDVERIRRAVVRDELYEILFTDGEAPKVSVTKLDEVPT